MSGMHYSKQLEVWTSANLTLITDSQGLCTPPPPATQVRAKGRAMPSFGKRKPRTVTKSHATSVCRPVLPARLWVGVESGV